MNIRDYWLLKLPTVRKQSSVTGRLIENLLVNDSTSARSALLEIKKITSIKLHEGIFDGTTSSIDTEEFKKRVAKDLDDSFKQMITDINHYIDTDDTLDKAKNMVLDERKKFDVKTESSKESKSYINKDINGFHKLFNILGLEKFWDQINLEDQLGKFGNSMIIIIMLAIAIVLAVLIYKKFASKGKYIAGIIISVVAVLVITVSELLIVKGIYNLISYISQRSEINEFKKGLSELEKELDFDVNDIK